MTNHGRGASREVLLGTFEPTAGNAVRGFMSAPHYQRVGSAATSAFALTVAGSRFINQLREQGRHAPPLRSLGRFLKRVPASNDARIHHYLPGIGIAIAAGGASLVANPSNYSVWLSIPFGVGVGLTADELRLLADRNDPYWGGQPFALAQIGLAGSVSAVLLFTFLRRGRVPTAASSSESHVGPGEAASAGAAVIFDHQPS